MAVFCSSSMSFIPVILLRFFPIIIIIIIIITIIVYFTPIFLGLGAD